MIIGEYAGMKLTVFLLAAIIIVLLTPLAIMLAKKFGIVDHPDQALKKHRQPTPYLGGAAIVMTLYLTLGLIIILYNLTINAEQTGMLLGLFVIFSIGLFDDFHAVKPLMKLSFQGLATAIVMLYGLGLQLTEHPLLNIMIMLIWVIGITNALNLVDIMDGLASGIGGIAAFFLAVLLFLAGQIVFGAAMLALAGACLGFLAFNFYPAKIFLGDAGSLAIGFMLACAAVKWIEIREEHHLLVPVLLLAIPIFETVYISILRLKAGKSPLQGSDDHFAKRMVKAGFTIKQTVLYSYGVGMILCLVAFWLSMNSQHGVYIAPCAVTVFSLIGFSLSKVDIYS